MFIYPNFKNNIINVSATLESYLGSNNNYKKFSVIEKELKKDYKNIVFIILDGLGYDVLNQHLNKDNILVKNVKKKITSVFPSTTTNATTTLMDCSYPGIHCWLGWSLYFKEINNCVDIYMNKISYKDQFIDRSFVFDIIPHGAYYNRVNNDSINVYTVLPDYVNSGISKNNHFFNSIDQMFEKLDSICNKKDKKFIYSYCGDPDSTMHKHGVTSLEAKEMIESLSEKVEKLHLNNPNSLIIVTADHGQIDVDSYIEAYNDQELLDCLERPLPLEVRATSFLVKKEKEKDFIKLFNNKYRKDLKLFKSSKLIKKGVFGPNIKERAKEFLGNYIAVSKNNKCVALSKNITRYKGHHTGLSSKEMYVPLIIIGNK